MSVEDEISCWLFPNGSALFTLDFTPNYFRHTIWYSSQSSRICSRQNWAVNLDGVKWKWPAAAEKWTPGSKIANYRDLSKLAVQLFHIRKSCCATMGEWLSASKFLIGNRLERWRCKDKWINMNSLEKCCVVPVNYQNPLWHDKQWFSILMQLGRNSKKKKKTCSSYTSRTHLSSQKSVARAESITFLFKKKKKWSCSIGQGRTKKT